MNVVAEIEDYNNYGIYSAVIQHSWVSRYQRFRRALVGCVRVLVVYTSVELLGIMKSTEVQTLGAPTRVRSLAHNNYLLFGMVTQHVESRIIREVQKDGLVNDAITFERCIFRENTFFLMIAILH